MTDQPTGGRRPGSPYLQIGSTVGAYRIESFVAHGGMAFVYEATDMRLGRHVALKLLAAPPAHESDFRERFMRESRYAASLDHPNIVPIYEAGEADGLLFIAMRFVGGVDLDSRLHEVGRLDGPRTLSILAPIADALDMAHAAGLVHRDVKPANILLADTGRGHEHVYLSDFGITKRTSGLTKLTATGNVIGTMAYTAPEQIRGEPIDARTDLYALGCVAYQCLTGEAPFVRDNQWALVYAHLNELPEPVSSHRPELAAVDPVIARTLEKDPAERFARCEDFTDALRDALAQSPAGDLPTELLAVPAASALPVNDDQPETDSHEPDPASAAAESEPVTAAAAAERPPAGPPGSRPRPDGPPASGGPPSSDAPTPPGSRPSPGGPPASDAPTPPGSRPSPGGPPASDAPTPPGSRPSPGGPPPPGDPRPAAASGPGPRHRASRVRRRSAALVALAAIAVVATLVAILGPWSGPRLESGSGRPAATAVATGSTETDSSSETGQSAASTHEHGSTAPSDDKASKGVVISTDAPTVNPPPETAPTSAAPAAAVAIPSVEGQPLAVGQTPGSVTVTPNGRFAYVANRGAGTVTVVDTNLNKVSAVIPVAEGPPWYVAFTPDGTRAYVSVYNSDKTVNKVAVLDARTTREIRSVDVDTAPYALAVTPDQKYVFVPSHDTAKIDVIDTGSDSVIRQIDVPHNPHAIKFSPDGRYAYVANHESNLISVVDVAAGNVVTTIAVGTSPHSLALSPDGTQIAVACYDSNDVYFVDVASGTVTGTAAVGNHPQDIEYSADGGYVYTANVDGNSVSVVDTATKTATATIPTTTPTSIAVTPDGRRAYVTNLDAGTLTILNTA